MRSGTSRGRPRSGQTLESLGHKLGKAFGYSGATVFHEDDMRAHAAAVLEHRNSTSNIASHVFHAVSQCLSADHADPETMVICQEA